MGRPRKVRMTGRVLHRWQSWRRAVSERRWWCDEQINVARDASTLTCHVTQGILCKCVSTAISSNCLYVSHLLTCEPFETTKPLEVRKITKTVYCYYYETNNRAARYLAVISKSLTLFCCMLYAGAMSENTRSIERTQCLK